jgi:hypothetical protein
MAAQYRDLPRWRARLEAIRTDGWPVARQVDWHLVRAEMNGFDFDHRVLKPWANNPAFYTTVFGSESDQPAREGPFAAGGVELWSYAWPLSAADAATIHDRIRAVPALLAQARGNLTGTGADLWRYAPGQLRDQSADLAAFSARLGGDWPALAADVGRAREATDTFAAWVEAQAPAKTGPSGVGRDHYTWYLRHVHLVPWSWEGEYTLLARELDRAHALLALEEHRNAALPPLEPIADAATHTRRFDEALAAYMAFLRAREILTVKPYMEPALRARLGSFRPGPREFFGEVDAREPLAMRLHGFHWFDKGFLVHEPPASPIRARALLYNIFDSRTEGLATGWEEWMMAAGLFDASPRSRELIQILIIQRAARALGDLRMHANEATLEDVSAFTAASTPRGWLSLTGNLVRGEQHLYLQQPAYGTSYLVGKMQIEALMARRRAQLGSRFSMRGFMDEFLGAGLIPVSLIAWELTGERPPWLQD